MEMLKFSTKPLRTPHFQNHFWVPQNSRILGVYNKKDRTFSFPLTCKLKNSKGKKKIVPGNISLPDSGGAPPLFERKKAAEGTTRNNNADGKVVFKKVPKRVLGVLSNLPLVIGEMFAAAGLMALGTIIDKGEVPEFYFQNFSEFTLGLDHMCSSPIFLGSLAILGASLMACTNTTQIPLLKVARRRSFLNSAEPIQMQEDADTLPRASVKDLDVTPMGAGYEVFFKGPSLHAFKGLASRFASTVVHFALLLAVSGGGTLSAADSFGGDVIAPPGVLSTPSDAFSTEVHVNRSYMDYDESGETSQFHTDISLTELNGKEVPKKTTSVNDPLRSIQAGDLQSTILNDKEGKFAGVKQPNSKLQIEIDGTKIVIVDAIGSTSLDLKTDPGVPIVYAGFGSLMLTTCISYLSHARLSDLQDGKTEVAGGKNNRAKGEFPDTEDRFLDQVPELDESYSSTEESDSFIGFRIQVGIWNKKDFDM
ncbi:cytochrome c biogenesis protein CCS1, chloroplastic [Nicotiana tabacum]|uniref:Cytochrome c biogenesis protein CCS1, chloroplastic n=1 Tax=Nicotiana tabacum TaxID=4097 RepID=A0A1S3XI18_TOBAC|nr:cytochrome c biogenesis protein CCS1, chloroplastic-like [Nicotiana tomentosiformis]XP_016439615.1 PREDICTED: cytochrome c biogenesis protein CCS1, chloroplastic-like [Nicotiana tabacum]